MRDRITIQLAFPENAEDVLNIYNHYVENTAVTFETAVPSLETMQRRISSILQNYPFLLAVKNDEVIGYAYANFFREREAYFWSAECSIYISLDAHRQGAGRMLYAKLEEILKRMGICNLYACIAYSDSPDENLTDASIRFHEKMGFTEVNRFPQCACKFGKWYGVLWMEKIIDEHTDNPNPPIPFRSIAQTFLFT